MTILLLNINEWGLYLHTVIISRLMLHFSFDTNSKAPPGLSWSIVIDHGSTQENSAYPPPKTNLCLLKSEELSQTFMLANPAQKYSVNF